MTEIDVAALSDMREAALARLERADRQRHNAPLFEAMQQRMQAVMTSIVPELTAGPIADARISGAALEESVNTFPERMAKMEVENAEKLQRLRARTNMLRNWLEAAS